MEEFPALKAKTCSYLTYNDGSRYKCKMDKKLCDKKFKFKDYKNCLKVIQH